jgi:dTDP-glucose 4,6-dehydratase
MKILATGAAGFIGSNFVAYMAGKYPEAEIRIYDKITYAGNMDNFRDAKGNNLSPYLYKKDICSYPDFIGALFDFEPDYIVHFAAETHVDNSITSPQEFLETNILGTEVILRALNEYNSVEGHKIKKMVHISTDEVYGSLLDSESDEDHAFKPNSPYSASKASGDMMCRAYFKTYDTPVTIIRGSNCYGPRQYPEKLIPRSLTNLMTGKKIAIYGKGINVREWIYTEDFATGVEAVLLKGVLGEAYNLGGGASNRVTNLDIAGELLHSLSRTEEDLEYVKDRAGHDMRYALNSNKLRALGWSPQNDLATGLEKTVTWYKENGWWWKPLL